jgi:poly-beta-1,6-N-acetyl-D-glucosamine synthase
MSAIGLSAVAWTALLFVVYTYAGYPLLVAAWARIAPRPVHASTGFEPSVSICMAVHDGERFLRAKLESLLALDYPPEKLEFLLCSDGSTDDTEALARSLAASDPRVTVLASERRLGKPTALNALWRQARGDVLIMTDVRQPLSRDAVRELVQPLADSSVGCVSGALVLAGDTGASAYWRYELFIRGSEARLGGMVGVSGSLYAVRRRDLGELPLDLLLDDMWVPLSVARLDKRIVLAERALAFDQATDDEREFSRKVRTLAGNYQLIAKLPWLLVPGLNPVWFQLVSHKLCRLGCPFALAVLFATTTALAFDATLSPAELFVWRGLWLAQAFCYVVALLGSHAGRIGSLARTFVVLNAAALVGLWRFVRGTQAVTW